MQNKRILEIGVGFGVLAIFLSKMHCDIFTTEHPSRNYLQDKKFRELLTKHNIKLISNDLYSNLPFQENSFDAVFFCDVIEHLYPWKVIDILKEINRILKDDGELIISTPNLRRFSNILRFLSGRQINPDINLAIVGETFGHIREYNYKELEYILVEAGFKVKNTCFSKNEFFDLTQNNTLKKFNKYALDFLFPVFQSTGDEIYMRAVK